MDLIQTIKDNQIILIEIQGFLLKLNKPEAPNSIADFVLDFEPLLEQNVQVVRLKQGFVSQLERRTEIMIQ